MALGICLISADMPDSSLRMLFESCGLAVWTPQSPDAGDGEIYKQAVCLVIDMPQGAGYRTLRMFRTYSIETPALLIVDPGREVDPETLDCGAVMDVIPRSANPLRVLRWVQSMCAAKKMMDQGGRSPQQAIA